MSKYDSFKAIKVEIDSEGVCWLAFNRPEKRNAMNPTLHFEMESALMALETDDAAKVIVLTGSGVAFSAGMEIGRAHV